MTDGDGQIPQSARFFLQVENIIVNGIPIHFIHTYVYIYNYILYILHKYVQIANYKESNGSETLQI